MSTIASRTYTNVALTVLIVLMGAMLLRPLFPTPAAHAVEPFERARMGKNEQQLDRAQALNSQERNAEATENVAAATREVAAAIRESAAAQKAMATALSALGQQ